jgi:hypothetical protein
MRTEDGIGGRREININVSHGLCELLNVYLSIQVLCVYRMRNGENCSTGFEPRKIFENVSRQVRTAVLADLPAVKTPHHNHRLVQIAHTNYQGMSLFLYNRL